ncbi:hypothetical protein DSO57_1025187 [Entomophthora muscae]|uniref:Uncharacterized protein n=1 Tax=Entomophthora muscae TaxID=34485 RepID=A0ACC2UC61_9FUNG|nr:hypothetical protein DSO57_1025187 [Entomophthora muscae]
MTYNFQIEYTPGKKNIVPDTISRREDLVLEPSQLLNLIVTASLYTNLNKEIQENNF